MPSQPDKNGSLGEIFWPEGVQDMMTSSEKGPTSEQVETLHNVVGKNFDVFSLSLPRMLDAQASSGIKFILVRLGLFANCHSGSLSLRKRRQENR